ncbi:hypothetical protein [Desulfofundulus thermosubterraneus]|uniref:Uncharacterized protein n=1 Tax=Desulfofundulus thermosubterraneus DSM 16057 TaxID=1121432 RepID=A0A1M6MW32_9FIRM|nr:hypothetical protein [Desulfofundulus thermosubterraneus]SHJ87667.1 hypothetical protein SAMN02745219_03543 [Desulfofundulus thermosubterraneus DSM 16057]
MAREFDLVIKALAERYPAHLVQQVRGMPVEKVERMEKEAVADRGEQNGDLPAVRRHSGKVD